MVKVGDKVRPEDAVARALLPGILQTIKLADKLGVEPSDMPGMFILKPGDPIENGQVIAETKGFFGKFKSKVESDYAGTVESVSDVTGSVLVREAPIPVDVRAYIEGTIAEIMPQEGAIVETRGAMVQGIFGVGGERHGTIRVAVGSPSAVLDESHIQDTDSGKIIVGGSMLSPGAIKRAAAVGAVGVVAGGIRDVDLITYLGYDIGVAITGTEQIPLTILVTEGFGELAMAHRTFELLKSLEGKAASINGATQIRAGVIRPEIIAPLDLGTGSSHTASAILELKPGTPIRVIREPYFGKLGVVTDLPSQLMTVDSGTEVRVLKAKLESGEDVVVPRANVEIIAS